MITQIEKRDSQRIPKKGLVFRHCAQALTIEKYPCVGSTDCPYIGAFYNPNVCFLPKNASLLTGLDKTTEQKLICFNEKSEIVSLASICCSLRFVPYETFFYLCLYS